MTPQDAQLLAALELQHAALGPLVARSARMQRQLATVVPAEWSGPARQAFALAMRAVAASVDYADETVRSAFTLTGAAARVVASRG